MGTRDLVIKKDGLTTVVRFDQDHSMLAIDCGDDSPDARIMLGNGMGPADGGESTLGSWTKDWKTIHVNEVWFAPQGSPLFGHTGFQATASGIKVWVQGVQVGTMGMGPSPAGVLCTCPPPGGEVREPIGCRGISSYRNTIGAIGPD